MREIKFRIIKDNKIIGYEKITKKGYQLKEIKEGIWRRGTFIHNINEELIRNLWTNLLDKQKKEIYEGDNIKWRVEYLGSSPESEIIFKTGCFCINHVESNILLKNINVCCEIIGNIYENKKLLEK